MRRAGKWIPTNPQRVEAAKLAATGTPLDVSKIDGKNTQAGESRSIEYRTWASIQTRCFNPRNAGAENYIGRGITMCARWKGSYAAFVADMGRRPSPKHSIDRIDNDKGYEPGNCKWATKAEQSRNRRSVKLSEHDVVDIRTLRGMGVRGVDLARAYAVSQATISLVCSGKHWS